MTTHAVVEHFDILKQIGNRLLSRPIALPMYALILQPVEEALGGRVDAPMSSQSCAVCQVGQNQLISCPDNVALVSVLLLHAGR